jgi:L-alanine-DL-glutamate epimerase-like enolase superfamily enzyme
MRIHVHPFELKLQHTFTISRESHDQQSSLVVELIQDGHSGFGEATANPYYGVTVENMTAQLAALSTELAQIELEHPEVFEAWLQTHLPDAPFLRCALDIAANDWYGKKVGKPLYKIWNTYWHQEIPMTNYTIGIASVDEMVHKMKETPFPIYKIKLGTDRDLDIIEALRRHTDAIFRVDANCAWTVQQTVEFSRDLKKLGVEFIEQPLPAEQLEAMEEVYTKSQLPLAADESCRVESDVEKCAGKFHIINIKLVKCGGLTPARRMIAQARHLNLQTMVGCMTESSVGISAIAQLLPQLDYVDMDGALLLSNDPASGISIEDGKIHQPTAAGTGAKLK